MTEQPALYQEIDRLKARDEGLQANILNLRSALVVAGHDPNCPVVWGGAGCISTCRDYRAENERLREALRWYADESHYPDFDPAAGNYPCGEVGVDPGARARQALGETWTV